MGLLPLTPPCQSQAHSPTSAGKPLHPTAVFGPAYHARNNLFACWKIAALPNKELGFWFQNKLVGQNLL